MDDDWVKPSQLGRCDEVWTSEQTCDYLPRASNVKSFLRCESLHTVIEQQSNKSQITCLLHPPQR